MSCVYLQTVARPSAEQTVQSAGRGRLSGLHAQTLAERRQLRRLNQQGTHTKSYSRSGLKLTSLNLFVCSDLTSLSTAVVITQRCLFLADVPMTILTLLPEWNAMHWARDIIFHPSALYRHRAYQSCCFCLMLNAKHYWQLPVFNSQV